MDEDDFVDYSHPMQCSDNVPPPLISGAYRAPLRLSPMLPFKELS